MTPNEFADKMQEIADQGAPSEEGHIAADRLLLAVLIELGYDEGCQIFESMKKWYA